MGNTLSDLGTRYALLKELQAHHEKMAKVLGGELAKIGEDLFREFGDSQQASFRLIGEHRFNDNRDRIITPVVKYKPTIISKPLFYQLLRTSGQSSLIKEVVAPGTLAKWVGELKRSNKPLPPEDVLRVFSIETATVRRAPSSSNSKEEIVEDEGENADE